MIVLMRKKKLLLCFIFLLAIILRFLYYPQNTYFGFDQARDAFAVREILSGHLKIVGPPTATGVFHHGVLYYYIFAPFYLFSGGDPIAVSLFLRVLNATGVFLLFLIVYPMFGGIAAFLAMFLFAVSFEQTQFSLFLNHPSLAVISVLIFYLGLSYWIFKKKIWGFFISLFGLGLSIQFEFVETQLIAVFALFFLFFRKSTSFNMKAILTGLLIFLVPISSFIISEIRHNFFIVKQIPNLLFSSSGESIFVTSNLSKFLFFINRHFHDNLVANNLIIPIVAVLFLIISIKLLMGRIYTKQTVFLLLWFFGGLFAYFFTDNDAYFYNTGTSIGLLVFASFLLSKLFSKSKLLTFCILFLIFISNLSLITTYNPLGPNEKINPQKGLLLKDEERVIDFIYQRAGGSDFAINALTMPYNVNTTWSYLFEWYGKEKYGYVPVWGGNAAAGFPGNIRVETARSKLPSKRFLIIEPQEGIPDYLAKDFLSAEGNYTSVIGEKRIGALKVLIQQPK